ncbi:MAG: hypothetical protein MMC23_006951 [Stictis urceolatum]|nr:hypothetical protein [Stictis urceolata]
MPHSLPRCQSSQQPRCTEFAHEEINNAFRTVRSCASELTSDEESAGTSMEDNAEDDELGESPTSDSASGSMQYGVDPNADILLLMSQLRMTRKRHSGNSDFYGSLPKKRITHRDFKETAANWDSHFMWRRKVVCDALRALQTQDGFELLCDDNAAKAPTPDATRSKIPLSSTLPIPTASYRTP